MWRHTRARREVVLAGEKGRTGPRKPDGCSGPYAAPSTPLIARLPSGKACVAADLPRFASNPGVSYTEVTCRAVLSISISTPLEITVPKQSPSSLSPTIDFRKGKSFPAANL